MKYTFLLIIFCFSLPLFSLSKVDSLLVKGDGYYFRGDFDSALNLYRKAERLDRSNIGAKTGIYNAAINSGRTETANKYAYILYSIEKSELNQDRIIYSDALLGNTKFAKKLLERDICPERQNEILLLAPQLAADLKYIDFSFSYYNIDSHDLLKNGFSLNLNYNFGGNKDRFNLNVLIQRTEINHEMNIWEKKIITGSDTTLAEYDSKFYEDIGQYEFFGQYNRHFSKTTSFYTGMKAGWSVNDYTNSFFAFSTGCRFTIRDLLSVNTYLNIINLEYSFFEFKEKEKTVLTWGSPYTEITRDYDQYFNRLTSFQYTLDKSLRYKYLILGGNINLVYEADSHYAEDMNSVGRSDFSENISNGVIRMLYGATTGFENDHINLYATYSEGDIFLVNSGEGRYLNANDSRMEMNLSGGIIFKKLFGGWMLGYAVSYSEFTGYTILTNSLNANYNWRNK